MADCAGHRRAGARGVVIWPGMSSQHTSSETPISGHASIAATGSCRHRAGDGNRGTVAMRAKCRRIALGLRLSGWKSNSTHHRD